VQTINPALITMLIAMCVASLMMHAGVAKRQLSWRKRRAQRPKRRRR
jgi:hypothetical protein